MKALTFMRGLVTSGVSPSAVSTFQEPQAMSTFDAGQAAFLRNWDYAYSNANNPADSKVVGKVGVAPPPTFAGQPYPGYSVVGGWNLFVNPHSANVKADLTFIKWMTSPTAQTILGSKYSEIPTLQAARTAPAVMHTNPVLAILGQTKLVTRPSFTPAYQKVSQAVYTSINQAISGSVTPKDALSTAQGQISNALSGKGL